MSSFVDAFLPAYFANILGPLSLHILNGAKWGVRKALAGDEADAAFRRCVNAGLVAVARRASADTPEALVRHLAEILERFFAGEETGPAAGRELGKLLSAGSPDVEELQAIFEGAGYDPETLPGLRFDEAMVEFQAAFLEAAAEEPRLRDVIQTHHQIAQTGIQRETLAEIRELVALLRRADPESVRVVDGVVAGEDRDTGAPMALDRGVWIEGDAMENIIATGDNNRIIRAVTYIQNQYNAPDPDREAAALEKDYLRALVRECAPLDLAVFEETDPSGRRDGQGGITVSDVFTTLYLKNVNRREDESVRDAILKPASEDPEVEGRKRRSGAGREEAEAKPIQATEAVEALDRLVILGAPGGGKSTLVNHMAARLARLRLGEVEEGGLPGWPDDFQPLPVRIVLRRFAAKLPEEDGRGTAGLVWDYLEGLLREWGCGGFFEHLQRTLVRDGGVVFFDGLDEVRETDAQKNRSRILEAVSDFAEKLGGGRVVVTCREYAYRKDDVWRLPDSEFPVVELDLFRDEQIEAFVSRWYAVTGRARGWPPEQAEDRAANLVAAIRTLPHLGELAPYPLLLTLMSIVHGATGLPRDRADLYERAVRLLLATWENRIEVDVHGKREVSPSTILKLGISVDDLRPPLEKLALAAHEAQEAECDTAEGCADLDLLDIQDALMKITGNSQDKANEIVGYINRRAGLLQARDRRTFTFPHRTFQEYLAATGIMRRSDFPIFLGERIRRNLPWWKEVFLLAAGSTRDTPYNIYQLVDQIVLDPAKTEITPERVRRAVLAAQTFHEANFKVAVESEDPAGSFGRVFDWTRDWLMRAMAADEALTPPERNEAGTALNWVGDPRFREDFHFLPDDELLGFVHVPAGNFQMGSNDYDDEKPPHEVTLPEFFVARFPVTVAQFRDYLKATGEQPKDERSLKGPDNHPVVYVSWHEAMAYCRWLQTVLEASETSAPETIRKRLAAGWRVRLPTEAEWERAAKGNDGRKFPWGNEADPNRANYDDSKIGSTSAVGCFPGGKTPAECFDMSGNVWEWTVSLWGKDVSKPDFKYPYRHDADWNNETAGNEIWRVVRGGAFFFPDYLVRCASRYWFNPDSRFGRYGFRFCVAPNPTLVSENSGLRGSGGSGPLNALAKRALRGFLNWDSGGFLGFSGFFFRGTRTSFLHGGRAGSVKSCKS